MSGEGSASAASGASGGEGQSSAAQASQGAAGEGQSSQAQASSDGEGSESQSTATKSNEGENKPPHRFHDVLTDAYPDRKFESSDDYDNALGELVKDDRQYRKRGTEVNAKLTSFLNDNPKVKAVFANAVNDGVPFNVAVARHFGPDDFTLNEGDDHYNDVQENNRLREADVAAMQDRQASFEKNTELSKENLTKFLAENDLSQEDGEAIINGVDKMIGELITGLVTSESLSMMMRAVQFEKAVSDANEKGELAGKNQSIQTEMAADKKVGDGIPKPNKGGELDTDNAAEPSYAEKMLGSIVGREKEKQDIFN